MNMKEITVLFEIKEEPQKEKINEELNWYDTIKQEMIVLHGGKLVFKYKEDDYLVKMGASERQRRGIKSTYRMLPETEDIVVNNHFKMVKNTNIKDIEEWFKNSFYVNDVMMYDANDDGMIFEVPDKDKEDFCDDLESQGFKYND